jgi:hypothetical protein
MAEGLKVDDRVYVPCARLGLPSDGASAFYWTKVKQVIGRSVIVDLPGGKTRKVASSAAHLSIGVAILRAGDFETEATLLDPLAKSLLQYCRLLLPDDQVRLLEVRTRSELRHFWEKEHAAYSHLILVGHGRQDGIRFGYEWTGASDLVNDLQAQGVKPKVIVSLSCKNGYAKFGQVLSRASHCQSAIGALHSVHGAIASQFCQTFLAYHLLQGETTTVAFRHARKAVPGATSFRLWLRGKLNAPE